MYLVKIWNSGKIESLTGKSVTTHNELLQLESETGCGYSSCIVCADPSELMNGIYNETDQDLQYYAVDVKDSKPFK